MKTKQKKDKRLSDSELVAKYETGKEIDLTKSMKGMLKQPPNSALKGEKPPRGT